MAATRIQLRTLLLSILAIAALEAAAAATVRGALDPLIVTGAVRVLECMAMMAILVFTDQGLVSAGLSVNTFLPGLRRGLIWSAGFGAAAAATAAILYLGGFDPLQAVRARLPADPGRIVLFVLVGGLIGPLAEELFFRGILYNYFRRWGVFSALLASTLPFVLLHPLQAAIISQAIGGIVFAVAFELEGSLWVPITIHAMGNLAIFALSSLA